MRKPSKPATPRASTRPVVYNGTGIAYKRGDYAEHNLSEREKSPSGLFCSFGRLPMRNRALDTRFTYQKLHVGRSSIHGLGVFAAENIASGERIIEYTGERITQREARKRFEKVWLSRARSKRTYLFYLDKRRVIDGAVGGSGAGYINHACDPNLRARRIRGHIFYFSRKPIQKGEELTVDYRFAKKAARVVCHCGSPACRGTINRS